MKVRILGLIIASLAMSGMALGDGLLGGGKGNGGGGGGSNSGGSGGSGGGKGSGGGSGPSRGSGGSGPSKGSGGGSGPTRGPVGGHSDNGGGSRNGSQSTTVSSRRDSGTPLIQNQRIGRSGRNNSTSNSNNPRDPRNPIIVSSVPSRDIRNGSNGYGNGTIAQQARREDRSWINYRTGYYQYSSNWQDCNFWYPYYSYTPSQHCIISPFYWYSNLPGYLSITRIFWTDSCVRYDDWRDYRYRGYDRYDNWSNDRVSEAVSDIEEAFLSRDLRSLDRLIPRNTTITIDDRSYRNYRVRSDDFYDMMADLVTNTRTRDFDITRVQTRGDYVRVYARHSFEDAWRRNNNVYMTFILRESRFGYEIVEFETSGDRY